MVNPADSGTEIRLLRKIRAGDILADLSLGTKDKANFDKNSSFDFDLG